MNTRKCTNCKKVLLVKRFSKRGVYKKSGKQRYSSWCKDCVQAQMKTKKCVCGKEIAYRSKMCQSCAALYKNKTTVISGMYRKVSKAGKINKKFLVRGKALYAGYGRLN